jgi:negative regulator of flagellin synthesis FlgM
MDINNNLPPVVPLKEIRKSGSSHAVSGHAPPSRAGDQVTLSAQARSLQAAREAIRRMPAVDMDKVNKIRSQIREGTYAIDPQKIASKILSESLLKEIG